MKLFIYNNIEHFTAMLILVSRIGDIVSTKLVTPKLLLEMNSAVKKHGLKIGMLSFILVFAPYHSIKLGLMVAVPSILVCVSNFSNFGITRFHGEEMLYQSVLEYAKNTSLIRLLLIEVISPLFLILVGMLIHFTIADVNNYSTQIASGFYLSAILTYLYRIEYFRRIKNE